MCVHMHDTSTTQVASLRYLLPRMAPGGTYVIEDLQSNYWQPQYPDVPGRTCVALLQELAVTAVHTWWDGGASGGVADGGAGEASRAGPWAGVAPGGHAALSTRTVGQVASRAASVGTHAAAAVAEVVGAGGGGGEGRKLGAGPSPASRSTRAFRTLLTGLQGHAGHVATQGARAGGPPPKRSGVGASAGSGSTGTSAPASGYDVRAVARELAPSVASVRFEHGMAVIRRTSVPALV